MKFRNDFEEMRTVYFVLRRGFLAARTDRIIKAARDSWTAHMDIDRCKKKCKPAVSFKKLIESIHQTHVSSLHCLHIITLYTLFSYVTLAGAFV